MSEAKEMSAPVLAWVYRVGYPETDVLTTTDDVLVTALVRRYGGRWAVEIWTSRDDEDDAPEHRISRAILDIDVPRADPIPPADADLRGADFTGAYRSSSDPPIPGWRLVDGRLERGVAAPRE